MDIRLYKKMPIDVQIKYAMQHGVNTGIILFRRGSDVMLYVLADFYVTIAVEPYEDAVISLKAFQSLKKLEPFLEHIDLKEVYGILEGS